MSVYTKLSASHFHSFSRESNLRNIKRLLELNWKKGLSESVEHNNTKYNSGFFAWMLGELLPNKSSPNKNFSYKALLNFGHFERALH